MSCIPVITLAFSRLPVSEVVSASGVFNFLRLLALGFGTSISVTLSNLRASLHDHRLTSHVSEFNPLTQPWLDQAHQLGLSG
ncbi:MAG: hypothetical protein J5I81_11575 [Nitrococcus mobilis]|nr:hypothetical protein [Nitrococcus mobilis]